MAKEPEKKEEKKDSKPKRPEKASYYENDIPEEMNDRIDKLPKGPGSTYHALEELVESYEKPKKK